MHGDTSTTMAQPLEGLGAICREHGALLYVDATATLGGMPVNVDAWQLDAVSAGLQKCMSGPPGSSPVTLSEVAVETVKRRKHIEGGIRPADYVAGEGPADHLQLSRPRHDHGLLGHAASQSPHRGDIDALCSTRMRQGGAG